MQIASALYNDFMAESISKPPTPQRQNPLIKWQRRSDLLMAGEAGAGPEAMSPELAAMVPQQILHDDEVVIVLTKPSLFFILYSSFFFIVISVIAGAALSQLARGATTILPSPSTIATVMVGVILARLVWALLVWASHVYMLTNLRIVTIKGVVNTHMFQAQLRKMQHTDLYRPLIQRIFGTGTIAFSTAASAGGIDSTWVMIARSEQTHEQIVAAINKANSR